MSANTRFSDLMPRLVSGLAMAALGLVAVWVGGVLFELLVIALCGAMVWELARMIDTDAPSGKSEASALAATAAVFVAATQLSGLWLLVALLAVTLLLSLRMPRLRVVHAGYMLLVLLAGAALILMRAELGWEWVLWLVLVVIASDVGGYFAGRLVGGPKLWPRVSPKKTWSGTVAGWALAAAVGAAMTGPLGVGGGIVLASVLVCMAGQAGDIAESALKRRVGVKDSSSLIPGHGGVMDRFDAMIAAAVMVLLLGETGVIAAITTG